MCGLCLWCSVMFHRTMIENMIKEGKIVPSEVTIKLLQEAMIKNENDKFLIDGFPRNEENRAAFENVVRPLFHTQNLFLFSSHDSLRDCNSVLLGTYKYICGPLILSKCFRPKFLLHSCYSLTVLRKRWKDVFWGATRFPSWLINCVSFLQSQNSCFQYFILCFQGRVDDNIETIKKRFKTFVESSLPVIEYYNSKDKVKKVLMNFYLARGTPIALWWCIVWCCIIQ